MWVNLSWKERVDSSRLVNNEKVYQLAAFDVGDRKAGLRGGRNNMAIDPKSVR